MAAPRLPGRYALGVGAVLAGAAGLVWRQTGWRQIVPLNHLPAGAVLALFLLVSAAELAGGIAMLWPRTPSTAVRAGAGALVAAYAATTLLSLPDVVRSPGVFNSWGNAGEVLSELAGAVLVVVLARGRQRPWAGRLGWAAYWAFAACVVTYMIEQWVYFAPAVALVPRWIPAGPTFWAVATTVFFGLAAAALLARRAAVPAAHLLTAMLLGFAVLVWVPILRAHPRVASNWTEFAETLAMAGAAWLSADWLRHSRAVR